MYVYSVAYIHKMDDTIELYIHTHMQVVNMRYGPCLRFRKSSNQSSTDEMSKGRAPKPSRNLHLKETVIVLL